MLIDVSNQPVKVRVLWSALCAEADSLWHMSQQTVHGYKLEEELMTCIEMLRALNTGNNIMKPTLFEKAIKEFTPDNQVQRRKQAA